MKRLQSQGKRFRRSKEGRSKEGFVLQSEQEARALLTNIQYNDKQEPFGYQKNL